MSKPTKKRIEQVAARLRKVFREGAGLTCEKWRTTAAYNRANWRRVARFALTELQPTLGDNDKARWPKSTLKPVRAKPVAKSCKLVRGKAVCK